MLEQLNPTVFEDYQYPMVSVIVPTFEVDEKIGQTLDSILGQHYPDLEVLIVDGGSKDRTLEVVKSYRDDRVHLISVAGFQRYVMVNTGITHAKGEYINILFPGDFYTSKEALRTMMGLAISNHLPELVYCGTLLRDGRTDPVILYRPFRFRLLAKGKQPTSLQSCWFREKVFKTIGKFDTGYTMRGGYEFLCRFALNKDFRVASTSRVFTDYDLRFVTRETVIQHFKETWKTVVRYFGYLRAYRWLFVQKDLNRIGRLMVRTLKVAFLGQ